jgi:hypothetical protein
MTNRRGFIGSVTGLAAAAAQAGPQAAEGDRTYWLRIVEKLAEPVLRNLAAGTLRQNMPVECVTGNPAERRKYTHLEALGRLLAGIASWLEVTLDVGPEQVVQQRYRDLARAAIAQGADPKSPDYLNFHEGGQALVDSAFLGQAILRAPTELWKKLDGTARRNLAAAMASSRAITPGFNNWIMFSATVEAALACMGEQWDGLRIEYAIRQHQQWYVGDGVYGDGPQFHFDYYNSFVIQPMLLDVLRGVAPHAHTWDRFMADALARAKRYAAIQERLIAPDGSYPAVGRSIAYRCGAFHLLAQMALFGHMPNVRSALTAVIRKTLDAPGTFDRDGWLTVGLCGHQPHLGESYISTGSLYLCSTALLPLGLKASDAFWSGPAEDWTARRLWRGEDAAADHAL